MRKLRKVQNTYAQVAQVVAQILAQCATCASILGTLRPKHIWLAQKRAQVQNTYAQLAQVLAQKRAQVQNTYAQLAQAIFEFGSGGAYSLRKLSIAQHIAQVLAQVAHTCFAPVRASAQAIYVWV